LPQGVIEGVERLANERRQTVSSAAAYLLLSALRLQPQPQQSGRSFLEMVQKTLAGLTEEERMLVDGIIHTEPDTEPI
jgi:hypothetical protein